MPDKDIPKQRDSADHSIEGTRPHWDVFLSHRAADTRLAEAIAVRAKQQGYRVWLDAWNATEGLDWTTAIENAIQNSRSSIILLSRDDQPPSRWVSVEWAEILRNAWDRPDFAVVPVAVGELDKIPAFLKQYQVLQVQSADHRNTAKIIDEILRTLETSLDAAKHANYTKTPESFFEERNVRFEALKRIIEADARSEGDG